MIHIFVGTKAQFIKMAPIMQELDRRGVAYNFIDAGQHANLTGGLIQQFGLRQPNVFLRAERRGIETIAQALTWSLKSLSYIAFQRQQIFRRIFQGQPGVCLIHGDTLTTLLSLFYAKRCGLQVAHVEAGLRSYHLFDPFPEEIIRLIAMRYSDILFAPSDGAIENLGRLGYSAKAVHVGANTILDTVRYALQCINNQPRPDERYAVVTIHRVETIYSRSRLLTIVTLLERIAEQRKVLFVLHEPTRRQLARFKLDIRLARCQNIELMPLQSYLIFVNLLAGADFVITDGGSIQEECYYLNVPCLIMRAKTERQEGLNENARLANFDQSQIDCFLQTFSELRRETVNNDLHPTEVITDYLLPWV